MDNLPAPIADTGEDQRLTIQAADFALPEGREIVSFIGRFGTRKRVTVVGDIHQHLAELTQTLIDDLHLQGNAVLTGFAGKIRIPEGGRAEIIDIGVSINRDHNNTESGGDVIVGVANGALVITTEKTGRPNQLDVAIRNAIGAGGSPQPEEEPEKKDGGETREAGVGMYL